MPRPEFSFKALSKAEWERWHEGLKKRIIEALGGFPDKVDLDAQVLEETRCDGYLRQRIELTTFPGLRMPMYVLIPSGATMKPLPTVIACHGHGYGSRQAIGCMGISGGGLVAAFAAALDERINAAVVSGYVNLFKESILAIRHCVDNYVPGLSRIAEMPDLVGLIAPRPLLVEAGLYDDIFPIEATRKAFEQIHNINLLLGVESKLAADFFPGEHRINREKAYAWLTDWLSESQTT